MSVCVSPFHVSAFIVDSGLSAVSGSAPMVSQSGSGTDCVEHLFRVNSATEMKPCKFSEGKNSNRRIVSTFAPG